MRAESDRLEAAYCLIAASRGEESARGVAGAMLIAELLDTVRAWREANSRKPGTRRR